MCKIQINTTSKGRHVNHLEKEAKGGRSPQGREARGAGMPRENASNSGHSPGQVMPLPGLSNPIWTQMGVTQMMLRPLGCWGPMSLSSTTFPPEALLVLWVMQYHQKICPPGASSQGSALPLRPGSHPPSLVLESQDQGFHASSPHGTLSAQARRVTKGPWVWGREPKVVPACLPRPLPVGWLRIYLSEPGPEQGRGSQRGGVEKVSPSWTLPACLLGRSTLLRIRLGHPTADVRLCSNPDPPGPSASFQRRQRHTKTEGEPTEPSQALATLAGLLCTRGNRHML